MLTLRSKSCEGDHNNLLETLENKQRDMTETQPLQIKRLHHLSRTTTNVQRLTDFYVKVMGFKALSRPPFDFEGSWLELGDIQIHVIERNPDWDSMPEDPFNTNGKPRDDPIALTQGHHTAFLTDNFFEIESRLKEMGIEYYAGKEERVRLGSSIRNHQLWFYDPDGNGIEIIQPRNTKSKTTKLQTAKLENCKEPTKNC